MVAPYYNRPSQEGMYQHYKAINDAVQDTLTAEEITYDKLVELEKDLGETRVVGQGMLSTPSWEWGSR